MKKSFAVVLAVCLVIVAVGSPAPSQPKPAPLDPQKLAAETEALIKKIPEARYVLKARAKELGAGIEPVFALVRDEIRFESYPGVFRGASGSFLARVGNAADRSLLLARLLELKGVPSRFAVGRLSTEDAERLFAHIFDPPRVAVGLAVPDAGATDAQTAGLEERLFARAKYDFGIIRSALGRDLAPLTSPSRDDILAELEAHVWVQANMSGRWINLDTAFPDAVPGKAYASADETVDALPEELYQRVTIRVIAERVADESLSEETALEVSLNTLDLLDSQIVLGHAPAEGGESTFVAEWLELELSFPDGTSEVNRRTLVDRAGAAWRKAEPLSVDRLRPLQRNAAGVKAAQAAYNIWFSAGGHNALQYAKVLNALAASLEPRKPGAAQGEMSFDSQAWVFSVQNFAWILMADKVIIPTLNESPGLRFYPDSPRISIFGVGQSSWEKKEAMFDLRRDHLRGIARKPGDEAAVAERKLWFGALEGAFEHELLAEQAAAFGADPARVETTSALLGDDGVALRKAKPPGGKSLLIQETFGRSVDLT